MPDFFKDAINITDLNLFYGKRQVLHDLDLSIPNGKFIGILGPNGAGKSSLAKCFLGINSVPKSTVFLQGQDIRALNHRQIAQFISYVPQNSEPVAAFTVEEMVEMALYFGKHSDSNNRGELLKSRLQELGLFEFRKRLVSEISGGEYQKVLLARALLQDTPIIVLDEPTNHLDLNHQISILELLKEEQTNRGKTVLAIFHDLNLALRYCDSLVLLDKGHLRYRYDTRDIDSPDSFQEIFNLDFDYLEHGNHRLLVPQSQTPSQLRSQSRSRESQ